MRRVCEPNRRVCRGSLGLSVGEGLISYAKTANRRPVSKRDHLLMPAVNCRSRNACK